MCNIGSVSIDRNDEDAIKNWKSINQQGYYYYRINL